MQTLPASERSLFLVSLGIMIAKPELLKAFDARGHPYERLIVSLQQLSERETPDNLRLMAKAHVADFMKNDCSAPWDGKAKLATYILTRMGLLMRCRRANAWARELFRYWLRLPGSVEMQIKHIEKMGFNDDGGRVLPVDQGCSGAVAGAAGAAVHVLPSSAGAVRSA